MTDAQQADAPVKKARKGQKSYGLKLFWISVISGRETWHLAWYETAEDRAKGRAHSEAQKLHSGKPRFTKYEEVER